MIEFFGEILLECWLEMIQQIIPEKGLPKWIRYTLIIIVDLISCGVFIFFVIGLFAWVSGEEKGKIFVATSVLIGALQVTLGVMACKFLGKQNVQSVLCFEARIIYIDNNIAEFSTSILCDVRKGEVQQNDIVLLLDEEDVCLALGTVEAIVRGRRIVPVIKKGIFTMSTKIILKDVYDKPIYKAVRIIKYK